MIDRFECSGCSGVFGSCSCSDVRVVRPPYKGADTRTAGTHEPHVRKSLSECDAFLEPLHGALPINAAPGGHTQNPRVGCPNRPGPKTRTRAAPVRKLSSLTNR